MFCIRVENTECLLKVTADMVVVVFVVVGRLCFGEWTA